MEREDERLLTRPLSPRQLIALDALAAAAYMLVLATLAVPQAGAGGGSGVPLFGRLVVIAAMALPLPARRIKPLPVLAVVLVASAMALVLGVVRDGFVGAGFALYVVASSERYGRREPTLLIAGLAVAGAVTLVMAGSTVPLAPDLGSVVVGGVVLAGAWTVGRAVRERRRFAERSAAQLVERAIAEERLRIARDLHDVVAHGLSLIVVKASTANHVIGVQPQEAQESLKVIETTGRAALAEMRLMLGVLRSEGSGAEPAGVEAAGSEAGTEAANVQRADLAPAPRLDQLPALAERVGLAGVEVDLVVSGLEEVPEAVGLTVYRIVQEALTNVVKHAAPAECRVAIATADGAVQVEVIDDGRASNQDIDRSQRGPGHGLIGMRERVRMLGGEFSAGPQPGRGFRVFARIPYMSAVHAEADR